MEITVQVYRYGYEEPMVAFTEEEGDYITSEIASLFGPLYHTRKWYWFGYNDDLDYVMRLYEGPRQIPFPKELLTKTLRFGTSKKEVCILGNKLPIRMDGVDVVLHVNSL
jgi:hypothetical protein